LDYQGKIGVSKKELVRYSIIEAYRTGQFSRAEAALKLNISERTVTRMAQGVREKGFAGVQHGNTANVPWNKLEDELVERFVTRYRDAYSKFNYSHALEMMAIHEKLTGISYSKFRQECRKRGLGKTKKRRASKARMLRERFAEEGYMWQMDGSPHAWNDKDTWSLLGLIDDATSKIPGAKLENSETTWGCMNLVRHAIAKHGSPQFILTDRAGWASSNGKRHGFPQFVRACKELGITIIATSTPETKGRIERMNRTFQDRLIPELDFFKIRSQIDSNRYLDSVFIPAWNAKFVVPAKAETTRYTPVPEGVDLLDIFCIKKLRKVNRNHTVAYEGEMFQIVPELGKNYHKKEVVIHQYEDGKVAIFYGKIKLESCAIVKQKRIFYRSVS